MRKGKERGRFHFEGRDAPRKGGPARWGQAGKSADDLREEGGKGKKAPPTKYLRRSQRQRPRSRVKEEKKKGDDRAFQPVKKEKKERKKKKR